MITKSDDQSVLAVGGSMLRKTWHPRMLAGAIFGSVFFATSSPADEAEAPSQPDSRADTVQEIIVTAQKRSQNIQDVAASVAAFSGDALQARQIQHGGGSGPDCSEPDILRK